MKVGVVLDQYYDHDGGAFTFQGEILSSLYDQFKDSPHTFIVFSPVKLTSISLPNIVYRRPSLIERGFMVMFRYWPGLQDRLNWHFGLEKLLREHGVEFAWLLSPRIKGLSLPFMTIVYDLQHRLQPQFPEVSAKGEWQGRERHYRRWLPRARVILAGTQAGKEEIMRFYQLGGERIRILPHPTPKAALASKQGEDAQILHELGLRPGFLLYPAQFWAHKNHVNLLRALAILKSEGLELELVLTGADFGSQAEVEQVISSLSLRSQVHMLGFVKREQLYALYRNALALIYVSFFGPENLPPLEAFALGCPVVAARVSGAEEQLGAAALLVNPAEPDEIAAAIRRVHEDAGLRQRLRAAGKVRAANWTTDDFVRGVFKVLDEVDAGT